MIVMNSDNINKVVFCCRTKEIFDAGINYLEYIGYRKMCPFNYGEIADESGNMINSIALRSDKPYMIFRENNLYYKKRRNWFILEISSYIEIKNYLFNSDPKQQYIFDVDDLYELE